MTDIDVAARPQFSVDGGASLHQWFREARDSVPVFFDETARLWRILRYDDALNVLSEWKTYSSELYRVMPAQGLVEGNFGMMDPPDHRRYRGYVSDFFTRGYLTRLAERITERVHTILDRFAGDGADAVAELAYPMPLAIANDLLGIPEEEQDREIFVRYADATVPLSTENFMDEAVIAKREAAGKELFGYLSELGARRRANPGDDLVSHMATAEIDGHRLTDGELLTMLTVLLSAGHIPTMGLLGNLFVCLAENPGLIARLRAEPKLIDGAVEEILRLRPSLPDAARVTNHEVTIAGTTVPKDQMLLVSLMSANRDERQFADPDRFDPARSPNQHLAFGHGAHFCLGMNLGRLQAQILLRAITERFIGITQLDLEWNPSHGLATPRRHVIALDPA
jgi:cytochrome P450